MAKQPKTSPQVSSASVPQPKLKATHLKTKHSYRVEKLSQFEFQAFKATRQDDGTYIEEKFGKCTLFTLVMRRVFDAMNAEASELFILNKAPVNGGTEISAQK